MIGASGSVGRIVVQRAHALGAHVIATATARDEAALRAYGAATIIDYTREAVLERLRAMQPDVIVDLVDVGAALADVAAAVRPGGRLISTLFGPPGPILGDGVHVSYVRMDGPDALPLEPLYAAIARGEIVVDVARTYPFEQAIDAMRALRDGSAGGKIVVTA